MSLRALLAAALLLGAAVPGAAAQTPVVQTMPAPDASDRRAMARVEQHVADLHKRLAITPAQQPQWDVFAGVMRDNARAMEQGYKQRQGRGAVSALDDMRGYAAESRMHADAVARLVPPFEALYAGMNPEQRAAADKTFQNIQRNSTRRGP